MKYHTGDYEAVHSEPIWRNKANFIFAAYLGSKGGRNEWEQLWGEKNAGGTVKVCCIPFFARNVSLGDEVSIDDELVLKSVVTPSGQTTFRVWFGDSLSNRDEIIKKIEEMNALMEWSSANLLAISIQESYAQQLADYLHTCEQQGLLQYETGRD